MHTKIHARYYVLLAITALFLPSLSITNSSTQKPAHAKVTIQSNIFEIINAIDNGSTAFLWTLEEKEDGKLLWALINGLPDLAKELITNPSSVEILKASINACALYVTPLIIAIIRGYTEIIELLIAHGADIHARTSSPHRTVLMYAAIDDKRIKMAQPAADRTNIVRALILAGADTTPLFTTSFDHSMSIPDCVQETIRTAVQERKEIIRTTIAHAATKKNSLSQQEIDNLNSMLLHAVAGNDQNTVAQILELDVANVDTKDTSGNTLLIIATMNKNIPIARLLLNQKANVNARMHSAYPTDIEHATPLIIATYSLYQFPQMVALLLEHGADINAKYACGKTALYLAAHHCSPGNHDAFKILTLLLDPDKKRSHRVALDVGPTKHITPLFAAAGTGNKLAVQMLIEAGADVSVLFCKHDISGCRLKNISPSMLEFIAELKPEYAHELLPQPGIFERLKNWFFGGTQTQKQK